MEVETNDDAGQEAAGQATPEPAHATPEPEAASAPGAQESRTRDLCDLVGICRELHALREEPKAQMQRLRAAMALPVLSDQAHLARRFEELLLDLLFAVMRFADGRGWAPAQVASCLNVARQVLLESFFAPDRAQLSLRESYGLFSGLVKKAAAGEPAGDAETGVLSLSQVVDLVDHVCGLLYTHYQTYADTFGNKLARKVVPRQASLSLPALRAPVPKLSGQHVLEQELETARDVDEAKAEAGGEDQHETS